MRKIPAYSYITTFLTETGLFTGIEHLIENQIEKTGRSRGEEKVAVYSHLMKMRRSGTVVSIKIKPFTTLV